MPPDLRVRPAVLADLPILRALIDASVRRLQAEDYTPAQREGALATVFGVDTQLIADGTYLVVEYCPAESQSHTLIVACGGWSKRKTLYGADQWTDRHDDLLAKIRAFFIHPDWSRRGMAPCSSKRAKMPRNPQASAGSRWAQPSPVRSCSALVATYP
jgi:hypothetical protein